MAIDKFQKEQLKKLRKGELQYRDASTYTILLDLCEGNGVVEVALILHNVATDMGEREAIEERFAQAKKWKW